MILDGKAVSQKILEQVRKRVEAENIKAHLVVILVGEDSASKIYVKNKKIAAEKVGIKSTVVELPDSTTESELLDKIDKLNKDQDVTGIAGECRKTCHRAGTVLLSCNSAGNNNAS